MEIKLYNYQQEMLDHIMVAFKLHDALMIQMPTGTGKTHVLTSVVKAFMQIEQGDIWIIAHRRELVAQIEDTIALFGMAPCSKSHPESPIHVFSIQWLSRHYQEMETQPTLMIIDEAHHALAKTYKEVMMAYPKAKKLGVTATPCRLNKKGFTDLFEDLLCAAPIEDFIKKGYLSDFDYVSISPDCEDQKLIDGLEKRAADGDFNIAEMQAVLDCKPSLNRLYQTVHDYAWLKKGIVFAINIEHAEHIAEFYRKKGIAAVAISSKTPKDERKRLIELFKKSPTDFADSHRLFSSGESDSSGEAGALRVLVNVDLFGEGFDCPDVEFIQLARPTLSLAKFLQMVGRGLRVTPSKNYCIILDNVGGYRLFGLPNASWNWRAMFLGNAAGKGEANKTRDWLMRLNSLWNERVTAASSLDKDTEMVLISKHDEPRFSDMKSQIERIAKELTYIDKTRYGFRSGKYYIRMEGELRGIYLMTDQVHIHWRLCRNLYGNYYLLHVNSESMLPVGSRNPWTYYLELEHCTDVYRDQRGGVYSCHQELGTVRRKEYLPSEYETSKLQIPKARYIYRYDRFLPYIDKDAPKFHSKDVDVMRDTKEGDKVMFNKNKDVIMRCWGKVELLPGNLAFVDGMYVNLYTMQAFEHRPQIVKVGFMDMLKDGDNYYFQKIRYMACIPLKENQFKVASDRFLFLDKYTVLRQSPQMVLRLDFARKKGYTSVYHAVSLEMDGKERIVGEISDF